MNDRTQSLQQKIQPGDQRRRKGMLKKMKSKQRKCNLPKLWLMLNFDTTIKLMLFLLGKGRSKMEIGSI